MALDVLLLKHRVEDDWLMVRFLFCPNVRASPTSKNYHEVIGGYIIAWISVFVYRMNFYSLHLPSVDAVYKGGGMSEPLF